MKARERQLSNAERQALLEHAEALSQRDYPDQEALVKAASDAVLPSALAPLSVELRDPRAGATAQLTVLVDVPTPENPLALLTTIGCLLGRVVRYEGEGSHIIEIKDDPNQDGSRPSFANSREFFFHTDLSYVPDPPPFLVMHSLSNDPGEGGLSLFASVDDLVASLSARTIEELSTRQFQFPAPSHYRGASVVTFPVLSNVPTAGPTIRFRRDNLRAESRAGIKAVIDLVDAMQMHGVEYHLSAGSVALVANQRFLHGRTAYVSSAAAKQPRHLNRMYVEPA